MKRHAILPLNVNPGYLPQSFVDSLSKSQKKISNLLPIQLGSSAMINMARTRNGYAFLNSQAEWALLLDSDMVWVPEAILRLVKTAKEKQAKVVSGLTFIEAGEGRIVPHAYQIVPIGGGGFAQLPYAILPSHEEPFRVEAVGGACLLVHRDVLATTLPLAEGKTAYPWWEDVYQPKMGEQMGEDLVFSQRVRSAGFEIWYEPRAFFGHIHKPTIVSTQEYADSVERSIGRSEVLEVDLTDADVHPSDEERAS